MTIGFGAQAGDGMSKVLVVADDMTGANDTGALFSKNGFPAATVIRPEISRRLREEKMVLCISTDTRGQRDADLQAY